jgi:bifunctional non-homologous end joining protein LigD
VEAFGIKFGKGTRKFQRVERCDAPQRVHVAHTCLQEAAAAAPGAARAPYPGFIAPCLATLRSEPPRGDGWLYELKYDGSP